jgi:hypothetical protein
MQDGQTQSEKKSTEATIRISVDGWAASPETGLMQRVAWDACTEHGRLSLHTPASW